MHRRPFSYLRVVATTVCNYHCSFCHEEGDPFVAGDTNELPLAPLLSCVRTVLRCGINKLKFVGGEPLLRRDLPRALSELRRAWLDLDISAISAGALPTQVLLDCFDAGLSRVNVSIHGFRPEDLARNNRSARAWSQREAFIETAIARSSRPVKLNYVLHRNTNPDDLDALFSWAAKRPVVVAVLDDLDEGLGVAWPRAVVQQLRGTPASIRIENDVSSLDTEHWIYQDGLQIELKHQRLGALAPMESCTDCSEKGRCGEGILALRLDHRGILRPCMDRVDLGFPLESFVRTNGETIGSMFVRTWMETL